MIAVVFEGDAGEVLELIFFGEGGGGEDGSGGDEGEECLVELCDLCGG